MKHVRFTVVFSCLLSVFIFGGCAQALQNAIAKATQSVSESMVAGERDSQLGVPMVYNNESQNVPRIGDLQRRGGFFPGCLAVENGFFRALSSTNGDETSFGEPSWKVEKNSLTQSLLSKLNALKANKGKIEYCSFTLPDVELQNVSEYLKTVFGKDCVYEIGQGDHSTLLKKDSQNRAHIVQTGTSYGFVIASVLYHTSADGMGTAEGARLLHYYAL